MEDGHFKKQLNINYIKSKMKKFSPILLLFALCIMCNKSQIKKTDPIKSINKTKNIYTDKDSVKLKNSKAIVLAEYLYEEPGGKYSWTKIKIYKVLRNQTNIPITDSLSISYYSWKKGIPSKGIYKVYLTSYPFGSDTFNHLNQWMLLEGDGNVAVDKP